MNPSPFSRSDAGTDQDNSAAVPMSNKHLVASAPTSVSEISLSTGTRHTDLPGRWKVDSWTLDGLTMELATHKVGKAEGPCFLQGEAAKGSLKANAMIANYVVAIDVTNGLSFESVVEKLKHAGFEASIFTTYHHLRDTSTVNRDRFYAWAGSTTVDLVKLAQYLIEVEGLLPEIVVGLSIVDEALHTGEGIMIEVGQQPLPRLCVVMPLASVFKFASRGPKSRDGVTEWRERIPSVCAELGLPCDQQSCDPARLFYFPRHPAGSCDFQAVRLSGNPLNVDAFDRKPVVRRINTRASEANGASAQHSTSNNGHGLGQPGSGVAPSISGIDPELFIGKTPAERQHLEELHQTCAVGFLGSNLRIIHQPVPDRPAKFITVKDAREAEAPRIVHVKGDGGGTKTLKMFSEYMQWIGRRTYDEIRFAPGVDDPRVYNLFGGWAIEPRKGNWSLLKEHLRLILCNGDEILFAWLMTYLSHMFLCPGVKIPVALVIRGQKGTGKSIVFDFIQELMGRYCYKVADGKRALGNFNAQYETTLLLVMEEAVWAGDLAKESILKDLITGKTIPIERKCVDPYMATNYMRVVMISNERWVVPASHDERRYAFFDCGSQHRGDIDYFKAMKTQMDNGGAAAMLHDMLNYQPEKGWDVLYTPPVSTGLQEQVVESLRGMDRFMYDLLAAGQYECEALDDDGIFLSETQPTAVPLRDLRVMARDYLADIFGAKKDVNYRTIERAVREWCGAAIEYRKGLKNSLPWAVFPPLPECREHARRNRGIG